MPRVRSNDANPAFSLLGEVMNMGQERLTRFGVSMPADLLDQFDEMLVTRGYNSRSEALRDLVRRELVEQKWEASAVHVTGILTIVYDHGAGVADALGSMQHAHHQEIVCTMHVHLDAHRCMEVIVLRGRAQQVKAIAAHLVSIRGVHHGRLVAAAIDEDVS